MNSTNSSCSEEMTLSHNELVFLVGLFTVLVGPVLFGLGVAYCLVGRHAHAMERQRTPAHSWGPGVRPEALPTSESWSEDGSVVSDSDLRLRARKGGRPRQASRFDLEHGPNRAGWMDDAEDPLESAGSLRAMDESGPAAIALPFRSKRVLPDTRLTTVCFRKGDWHGRLQKPFVMGIRLDDVHSVPELCLSIRDAYEQAWERSQSEGECDLCAITIEYQLHDGPMIQLTADTPMPDLEAVDTLFVTTNISHVAVLSPDGGSLHQPSVSTPTMAVPPPEEQGSMLVDMSLAGCCGVQSSCGGLRITSMPDVDDMEPEARRQRQVELSRFRAAKFRHYFTM